MAPRKNGLAPLTRTRIVRLPEPRGPWSVDGSESSAVTSAILRKPTRRSPAETAAGVGAAPPPTTGAAVGTNDALSV